MIRDLKSECAKTGVRASVRTNRKICDTILRLLFASRADMAIAPLQDVMRMGREGRINAPSTVSPENWSYRFTAEDFTPALARRLARLVGLRKKEKIMK